MAIVLLYSFCVMSAGCDSMSARGNLPFQFNKSQNLSSSIVFGLKTTIFDKFIVYHLFIIFYQISIIFFSFTIKSLSNFYRILLNSIVLGQYDTLEELYCSQTRSSNINLQPVSLSCRQTLDRN